MDIHIMQIKLTVHNLHASLIKHRITFLNQKNIGSVFFLIRLVTDFIIEFFTVNDTRIS